MEQLLVEFTVYGEAKPGGSKRAFKHPSTGNIVVTDMSGKGGREWRNAVAGAARDVVGPAAPLYDEALVLELRFFRPRPKGHHGARGLLPSAPAHLTTRPDLLKLARSVEDALTGVLYRDDSLIVEERLSKHYGEPARCEVVVLAAGAADVTLEEAA